jgi:hypothetical protein
MKYILLYSLLIFTSIRTAYCQNNWVTRQGGDGVPDKKIFSTGFENIEADDWDISTIREGKGSKEISSGIKRSGVHSLKLTKTNSFGYVIASAKKPVIVKAGQSYTFRLWFNTDNAHITSFLIPRLITDTISTTVVNPYSPLWIGQDWESQSLLRNSPSAEKRDWIKRVVFYENKTDKVQQLYLQVALYGNPFTVYIDDLEFEEGKLTYTREPEIPGYAFTEAEVKRILSERKEETASFYGTDGTTHFTLNGKKSWPVFYRAWYSGGGSTDPRGFGKQGININNVELILLRGGYTKDKYRFAVMDVLRKNPNAQLYLELDMDPDSAWLAHNPDEHWETKEGKKIEGGSYASEVWRKDGATAIRTLIEDLKENDFWKLVVGANVSGGHDWQFWTKAIGEVAADYSPANVKGWHRYLEKNYISIAALNKIWKTGYSKFSDIPIPDPAATHESYAPILARGPVPDYRQYAEAVAYDLREHFATAVREESSKDIFISAYGMPMENQHGYFLKTSGKKGRANNAIASMSYYAYRQPGFASGYHPEQSFGFHNSAFIQELDLRYKQESNELNSMWVGSQPAITDWRNVHRKLVGVSLAQDQGYWYYELHKQFLHPELLEEIGAVKKIADALVTIKAVPFRPDVCLVRFDAESRYYGSSVDNAVGATNYWEYMLLETSGVPFDVHYLNDLMSEPVLQQYKVYVFHNYTYLTEMQKDWINKNLKKNNRTIIWLYDTGYVTDDGLSVEAIEELTGLKVNTEPTYSRSVVAVNRNRSDRLIGGKRKYYKVPEFQGMAEALCSVFNTTGKGYSVEPYFSRFGYTAAPGVSRYQKFWIESGFDAALATYKEDKKVAIAVKRFADWRSVYVAAPNALAGEMFHNIAKEAKAYRTGPPGLGELRMSGRFVSYHAVKTGKYKFQLPKGASKIIDVDTGKVLAQNTATYTIDGKAQTTYWFFIE